LIAKMPAVFASPGLGDERRAKGLTSYLVPLTRQPAAVAAPAAGDGKTPPQRGKDEMVFDVAVGAKFQQITDGTSNTILVLEANPKSAVVWTKPDDVVIDPSDLTKDLRGQWDDGFNAVFGDGHVQFLKTSMNPTTLLRLLMMNDGQPVGEYH
jgi:prepilin-type processing-associated H-X9-DG protein